MLPLRNNPFLVGYLRLTNLSSFGQRRIGLEVVDSGTVVGGVATGYLISELGEMEGENARRLSRQRRQETFCVQERRINQLWR